MNVHSPISVSELAGVVRPCFNQEPRITFVFKSGRTATIQFDDVKKRDELWDRIETQLKTLEFIPHWNTLVRAEHLTLVERGHTPELGSYLHFHFRSGAYFIQRYQDEDALAKDYKRLLNILSFFQDRHTNGDFSSTRH